MSMPLFKNELKSNWKILVLFLAILSMYAGLVTAMYDPKVGAGMNALTESMPELFAAFGMENPGVTLMDFEINYLYGFILIVIPFIYTILMCYKLMAKYIDKGSMAYLLNSRYHRINIAVTQALVLFFGLFVQVVYSTAFIFVCSQIFFGDELPVKDFLLLNFGLFSLHLFLGSLCFFFACLFNEIRYSVGLGAGLGLLFVLLQMLSQVSEDIEFFKYGTPLTLFRPEEIVKQDAGALLCLGALSFSAILFLAASFFSFKRRDLPL